MKSYNIKNIIILSENTKTHIYFRIYIKIALQYYFFIHHKGQNNQLTCGFWKRLDWLSLVDTNERFKDDILSSGRWVNRGTRAALLISIVRWRSEPTLSLRGVWVECWWLTSFELVTAVGRGFILFFYYIKLCNMRLYYVLLLWNQWYDSDTLSVRLWVG